MCWGLGVRCCVPCVGRWVLQTPCFLQPEAFFEQPPKTARRHATGTRQARQILEIQDLHIFPGFWGYNTAGTSRGSVDSVKAGAWKPRTESAARDADGPSSDARTVRLATR